MKKKEQKTLTHEELMAQKKQNPVEPVIEDQADEETVVFEYDTTVYGATKNPETGRYDILLIRVNTETDQAVVEREPTRRDSIGPVLLDITIRTEQEFTKKGK